MVTHSISASSTDSDGDSAPDDNADISVPIPVGRNDPTLQVGQPDLLAPLPAYLPPPGVNNTTTTRPTRVTNTLEARHPKIKGVGTIATQPKITGVVNTPTETTGVPVEPPPQLILILTNSKKPQGLTLLLPIWPPNNRTWKYLCNS